jgi:hypothetical protein
VPTVLFQSHFSGTTVTSGTGAFQYSLSGENVSLLFAGSYWQTAQGQQDQQTLTGAVKTLLGSAYLSKLAQYEPGGTIALPSLYAAANDGTPIALATGGSNKNFPTLAASNNYFHNELIAHPSLVSAGTGQQQPLYVVFNDPADSGDGVYDYGENWWDAYGNHDIYVATLARASGGINIDQATDTFSHEVAEATASAVVVNDPGYLGMGSQICDNEPEDSWWGYAYRVNGVLVQAYWSQQDRAWVVPNGNSAVVRLTPTWSGGSFTGASAVSLGGAQLGAIVNDQFTVTQTPSRGLQVALNGQVFSFESGFVTALTLTGASGANTLVLQGASSFTNEVETPSSAVSGSIVFDGSTTINYNCVATIDDTMSISGTATFKGTSAAETINVLNGGLVNGFQTSLVNCGTSGTLAPIFFANKPVATVSGVNGADTININNPNPAAGLTALNVWSGSTAGVTLYVKAIGVPTTYIGGANATVNVGKAGSMQSILAPLNLENPPAFNTIVLDDSNDALTRTVTMRAFFNPADPDANDWAQVSGLATAVINYEDTDSNTVTIDGGTGGDTLNVQHLGTTTTFVGGADSTVNVGWGGSVQGILYPLNLQNPPAYNAINIDDSADPTARTVTLSSYVSSSNSDTWGRINGLSASANINYDYNDTSSLTINGGTGGNTFNVNSTMPGTPGTTTINAGTGANTFNIAASALGVYSSNIFNGQGGNNIFNVTGTPTTSASLAFIGGWGSNILNAGNLVSYSLSQAPGGSWVLNDWFEQNLSDPGVQSLARTDFVMDGSLNRNDVIGLFNEVASNGPVTSLEFASLQNLVTNASLLNIPGYVANLAGKLVNGSPANATYDVVDPQTGAVTTIALGNLAMGSSSTQLTELIGKWFLGMDVPVAADGSGNVFTYATASGTLFGAGGPSYQDVGQGDLGDCYFLSSLGEVALDSPQSIRDMFIDNGDGTYTVGYFHQVNSRQVADYVTVNLQLPQSWGDFIFAGGSAGGFQSITSASNVLWVALAEKAYAQLAFEGWSRPGYTGNNYQNLGYGSGKAPLQQILGESTQEYSESQSTGLSVSDITTLIADIQAGDMITIGTKSPDNNTFFSGTNIVEDHMYYVSGYDASTGLFTLENPWGYDLTRNNNPLGTLQLTTSQLETYFYYFDVAAPHVA